MYRFATSGIAAAGNDCPRLSNHLISRYQDGPLGTFKPGGIISGSTPTAASSFEAGSTSTAITILISSRSTRARSANKKSDTRLRSSGPISDRTSASNAAWRHEPCVPSRLRRSTSDRQIILSGERSRAMRDASSTPLANAAGAERSRWRRAIIAGSK